jgi:putative phosphotransacetylase
MKKFIVETSARHLHITQEDLEILFGEGTQLINKKELSQPGQFACEQRVNVIGPKSEIKNVVILGPTRNATQIEVSATDARSLGVVAPIKESGDIEGSAGCKITGPCGEIELQKGVIVAKRHIHLTPESAKEMGVENKQIVNVKVETKDRSLIFGDVVCRVDSSFATAMHIDTDEANAAGCSGLVEGYVV